jgi:centractin
LFHPELVGEEWPGAHTLVTDAISKVDLDLRRPLFNNIVLSGGTTLLKGSIRKDVHGFDFNG